MNQAANMRDQSASLAPDKTAQKEAAGDLCKLSDRELLANLFGCQLERTEADAKAGEWMERHQGLRGMMAVAESPLALPRPGPLLSDAQWLELLQICGEIFTRQLREGLQRGTPLTSPADTVDYLQRLLQGRRREIFQCMFLDTRHRVICHEELFQGSIDGACVYPRVVAEHALRHNAAAVIVAHNHPSGVSEPSLADQAITRRLKDALALLEIRLLDHFVIGDGSPVSMASRGMI